MTSPSRNWELTLTDGRKVTVGASVDVDPGVWLQHGTQLLQSLTPDDTRTIIGALTQATKHLAAHHKASTRLTGTPATMPQTLYLLQLSRGEQPKYLPPITRRELLRKRWMTRDRTITAAGSQALTASKYLDEASRKLDAGKTPRSWQGMP